MKRREFIGLLGGTAATWPLAARAQQARTPVVGFMSARSFESDAYLVAAFRKGLGSAGFTEGRNVTIEYRWADGRYDRLSAIAAELIGMKVSVLVAAGGTVSALTAKAATTTVPIVFLAGAHPVEFGLVASINRPGGNATGVTVEELGPKRIGLLRTLIPAARLIGFLFNSTNRASQLELRNLQDSAGALGVEILPLDARSEAEIDTAFKQMVEAKVDAFAVGDDASLLNQAAGLVAGAAHFAVPAIYARRSYVTAGGLMSYGNSIEEQYVQGGVYLARVLNGAAPAELPVMEVSKFEFVINLKTVNALGLNVPPDLLSIADEVIE